MLKEPVSNFSFYCSYDSMNSLVGEYNRVIDTIFQVVSLFICFQVQACKKIPATENYFINFKNKPFF